MSEVMASTDWLVTTEEDIERVFGIMGKDYEEAAARTAERFPLRGVAITLRDNPLVWRNSWTAMVWQAGKVRRARADGGEIGDRPGAGASFAAGLLRRPARARRAGRAG